MRKLQEQLEQVQAKVEAEQKAKQMHLLKQQRVMEEVRKHEKQK